jgi:hypothetical protein
VEEGIHLLDPKDRLHIFDLFGSDELLGSKNDRIHPERGLQANRVQLHLCLLRG